MSSPRTIQPGTVYHATPAYAPSARLDRGSVAELMNIARAGFVEFDDRTDWRAKMFGDRLPPARRIDSLWHPSPPRDVQPPADDRQARAWAIWRSTGSYVTVGKALGINRWQARTAVLMFKRRMTIAAGLPAPSIDQLRGARK